MSGRTDIQSRLKRLGFSILFSSLIGLNCMSQALAYLPSDDDYLCDFPQDLKFYNFNRWFSYELPLKVYISPIPTNFKQLPYQSIIQRAFANWSEVMPQFHFQFINNPSQAQIVIKWTEYLPASESDWGRALFPQTYFNTQRRMLHKAEMHIALKESKKPDAQEANDPQKSGAEASLNSDELLAEVIHALGHTLGLPHSKNREDLMSAFLFIQLSTKSPWSLTARDASTLKKLYSLSPRLEGSPCNGGN